LVAAKSKYKQGSQEYDRIQGVLNVLGTRGEKGVVIRFDNKGADGTPLSKAVGARTSPNLQINGQKVKTDYEITFNTNNLKAGSAAQLAHEGQHLVDFRNAFSHAKVSTQGVVSISAAYDLSIYQREDRGLETGQCNLFQGR
jgi:hypothetical protein